MVSYPICPSCSYLFLVKDSFLIVVLYVGYIGEFEYVDDHRSGKIVVELNGRLNKCGVISPRFDVGVKEIEGWTARLLPSRQVCLLPFSLRLFVINSATLYTPSFEVLK